MNSLSQHRPDRLAAIGDGHGPGTILQFLRRVDAESAVNRRVEVRDRDRILHDLLAQFVRDSDVSFAAGESSAALRAWL